MRRLLGALAAMKKVPFERRQRVKSLLGLGRNECGLVDGVC
ncbi:MAG: hypothetical protein JWM07_150 [Candidatus Saccharibacteria bacterium]|nr:hypothetical protein [Candidatus Saccharibacteria bacterium]